MYRRSNSVFLKCPVHSQPIQYICTESHVCNPEKNRALCEECLKTHNQNSNKNNLESIDDFLSGDFIYSDMQKTIETLETKLSEDHFESIQKVIEETFDNLQNYFIKAIQETKKNILDSLKGKRFERHYVLTSWKRLQDNLENKLEVLCEQNSLQQKDLEEYIELFHEFKTKAKSEQTFSKFEEEFERKLCLEDETLKELKNSLAGTLDSLKKNIWNEAPNLAKSAVLDVNSIEIQGTVRFGEKGFRLFGLKYLKEIDKVLLCDRDSRIFTYDLLTRGVKDLGVSPQFFAIEYIPKLNKVLLGCKGSICVKDLGNSMIGEEQEEVKLPGLIGRITCLKYLPEKELILCSGLFPNIYCLSLEGGFKVIDTLQTNQQNCNCIYYIKGRGILAGGLENGYINLYQTKDKSHKETLKGHTKRILAFDYNYVRDILISGCKDGSIRVWMYRNDQFLCNKIIENPDQKMGVCCIQFISNTIIMSLHKDLYIRFWDALTGKETGKAQVFRSEGHVAQYIEERRIIVAGEFEEGKMHILKFV